MTATHTLDTDTGALRTGEPATEAAPPTYTEPLPAVTGTPDLVESDRRLLRNVTLVLAAMVAVLPFVPSAATFEVARGEPEPLFFSSEPFVRLESLVSIPLTIALAGVLALPVLVYALTLAATRSPAAAISSAVLGRGPYFVRHIAFVLASAGLYAVLTAGTVTTRGLALAFAAGVVVLSGVFGAVMARTPRADGTTPSSAPAVGTALLALPWLALVAEIAVWGAGSLGAAVFVPIIVVLGGIGAGTWAQATRSHADADETRGGDRLHVAVDAGALALAAWLTLLIASA